MILVPGECCKTYLPQLHTCYRHLSVLHSSETCSLDGTRVTLVSAVTHRASYFYRVTLDLRNWWNTASWTTMMRRQRSG